MPVPPAPSAAIAAIEPAPGRIGREREQRQREHKQRARQHRRGDDADRLRVLEARLQVEAADRVAEARKHNCEAADERGRVAAHVHPEQQRDADDPDPDADAAASGRALLVIDEDREQRGQDRRGGDKDPGERGGDLLLAPADQEERRRPPGRRRAGRSARTAGAGRRSAPRWSASGASTSAASSVRRKTTIAGEKSSSPILMKRYDAPHSAASSPSRIQERRSTDRGWQSRPIGFHDDFWEERSAPAYRGPSARPRSAAHAAISGIASIVADTSGRWP